MLKNEISRELIWDNELNMMVVKNKVEVVLFGNRGSVFHIEGPLFCEDNEVVECILNLRNNFQSRLKHNTNEETGQDINDLFTYYY
jgi:hypothetical protein